MFRTRKIVSALALLVIFTVLISCMPRGLDQEQVPPSETPRPTKTQVQPVDFSANDIGGVITFATYSFLEDAYKPVLEEFRKQYPSITVQVRELPLTMDPRQIASIADTTLLMYQPQSSGIYFLDLSPFEEGDPTFEEDSFWPGILDSCQDIEGRVYGLPVFAEPVGIYYQEKAFDDAGLPYPKPGWTWDDFQKAVNALTRTENGLPVYGFADDSFMDTPDETVLSPHISFLLDQSGGEIDVERFNGELQWYPSLVKSGSLYSENIYPQRSPVLDPKNKTAWSTAFNETWKISHEMFQKNPPAMWKGRLDQIYWADANMEALPDGSLNMSGSADWILRSRQGIGWVPFPVSADGQNDQTTPNTVTCAVISSGTQNPRAAWAWVNFLSAHPILPEWSIAAPAQPSAAEASGYWGKLPEKARDSVRFGLEHGWYYNPFPEAVLAVNRALLQAVDQNTELLAALTEADSQLQTVALPTPDMTPIVVVPPQPTLESDVIKIDYYSPFGGSDVTKGLVEEFQHQNPGIAVEIASPSSNEVGGAAGLADTYDCFAWLPENGLPVNLLQDLDQFLSSEKVDVRSDYTQQELNEYSQDGKLFGFPTAYRPNLIYYNADLLTQRGLKPPALDWTYSDFIELINAATSNTAAEPIYGFALEYPTQDIDFLLAGRNVSLVDPGTDVPAYLFDTPEAGETFQWLAEQVQSGVILPVTPITIGKHQENVSTVRQLILDGRVAMWVSWFDQEFGGTYSLQDARFNIGVAPIPLPEGNVNWRPNQLALGQYISNKAENPRACWEWIKFVSEQPNNSLGVPARRSVRESEAWVTQVGSETARVYQTSLEERRVRSQENVYSLGPVRDWLNEVLAEIVDGANPPPLLTELQRKANVYSACLAASSDYQSGDAQQRSQAEEACAAQTKPK